MHRPRPRPLPSLSRPSVVARGSRKSRSDGPQRATGGVGGRERRFQRNRDEDGSPKHGGQGPDSREGEAGEEARRSRPGGGARSAGALPVPGGGEPAWAGQDAAARCYLCFSRVANLFDFCVWHLSQRQQCLLRAPETRPSAAVRPLPRFFQFQNNYNNDSDARVS